MSEDPRYDINSSIVFSIGGNQAFGNVGSIQGNQIGVEHTQLAKAAEAIQNFLKELASTYPSTTPSEKLAIVGHAVEQIEKNPSLKKHTILLKSAEHEDISGLISNPLVFILLSAIEGWQDS